MEPNRTDTEPEQNIERPPRGLDQVSHFFLTQAAERATRERSPGVPEGDVRAPRENHPPAIVLRPSRLITREHLLSLLRDQPAAIEEGMRVLDVDLPCEAPGNIELLALDSTKQLVVIDVEDKLNDSLLLRGIAHLDWVVRNIPLLRRMYPGQVINFSLQPRLFLLAPEFSPLFRCAVRHITSLPIHCFQYHAVGLPEGTGIFCEQVFGSASRDRR